MSVILRKPLSMVVGGKATTERQYVPNTVDGLRQTQRRHTPTAVRVLKRGVRQTLIKHTPTAEHICKHILKRRGTMFIHIVLVRRVLAVPTLLNSLKLLVIFA